MGDVYGSNFRVIRGDPKIIEIPAHDGTPAEIDCSSGNVSEVAITCVSGDVFWVTGANAAVGLSKLGSDSTRGKFNAPLVFEVAGSIDKIYVRAVSGGAVAGGLSYVLGGGG